MPVRVMLDIKVQEYEIVHRAKRGERGDGFQVPNLFQFI
jgi:hypothetical protein